jgi:hypothetical protein
MAKKGGKKGDKGLKSEFGAYKDEESRKAAMEELRRQFDVSDANLGQGQTGRTEF